MKQFWVALALLAAVSVPADAQGLPPEVAAAYREYDAAFGEGDYQAAQSAAARAYEAARAAGLDVGTLGLLAENYAFALAQAHNYQLAAVYWERSAEHGEAAGAAPLDMAWRWHNAGLNAYASGDLGGAIAHSSEAQAALDAAGEIADSDMEFAGEAYLFAGRVAAQSGNFQAAGPALRRSLDLFALTQREPDAEYALAHFLAGLTSFLDQDFVAARYHFHLSSDITREVMGEGDVLYRALVMSALSVRYGEDHDELSQAVNDLLAADPIHTERYTGEAWDRLVSPFPEEGDFVAAVPVERVEPRFPMRAAEMGWEGVVAVRFSVDEAGRTRDIDVVASMPPRVFDASAVRAVGRWIFEPATLDGRPVRQEGVLTQFSYQLAGPPPQTGRPPAPDDRVGRNR